MCTTATEIKGFKDLRLFLNKATFGSGGAIEGLLNINVLKSLYMF